MNINRFWNRFEDMVDTVRSHCISILLIHRGMLHLMTIFEPQFSPEITYFFLNCHFRCRWSQFTLSPVNQQQNRFRSCCVCFFCNKHVLLISRNDLLRLLLVGKKNTFCWPSSSDKFVSLKFKMLDAMQQLETMKDGHIFCQGIIANLMMVNI